jgi:hypothetical protein
MVVIIYNNEKKIMGRCFNTSIFNLETVLLVSQQNLYVSHQHTDSYFHISQISCNTCSNIEKFLILLTDCMILRINGDYFATHHLTSWCL